MECGITSGSPRKAYCIPLFSRYYQGMSLNAVENSQQTLPIVCLACVNAILRIATTAKGNRLLKTDASAKVVPLISKLLEEEYLQREPNDVNTSVDEVNVHSLIYNNGKMCRHCFTRYNRVTDLLDTLKGNVSNAVGVLSPNTRRCRADSALDASAMASTPKRPRLCVSLGPESPDTPVLVSCRDITKLSNN